MADKIPAKGKWEGGSKPSTTVQEAAKMLNRADRAVRRGADSNHAPTYEYSLKAREWAKGEMDAANERAKKKTSASKQGVNQK